MIVIKISNYQIDSGILTELEYDNGSKSWVLSGFAVNIKYFKNELKISKTHPELIKSMEEYLLISMVHNS